jgi:pimeloyl-ACP methyl ester carboxylesterase
MGFPGRLAGIWGEFDATAAQHLAERAERLRQFQPQATFDVFEGAGHWVQYEAAARFNRRLAEIVNGAP